MLRSRHRVLFLACTVVCGTAFACVPPKTQLGTVPTSELRAEQLKQDQYVLRAQLREQQRLDDIAFPLLRAARELCADQVAPTFGARFANLYTFDDEHQAAAIAMGFRDTLMILEVTHGSAADVAGLRPGDRLLEVNGDRLPIGPRAVFIGTTQNKRDKPTTKPDRHGMYNLLVRHGRSPMAADTATADAIEAMSEVTIAVPADSVCGFGAQVVQSEDLNAFADGKTIFVTTAMMRFAATDDELAMVVSHEIAHDAMHHIDAQRKNARTGAILGAVLDVAAASAGVNTLGHFSADGGALGAMKFSQDFEREADYVGMYVLARSGRPVAGASEFWRRMAQESPKSVRFASSHPTTAERFLRLEHAAAEIEAKRAAGRPLLPDVLSATTGK